MHEFIHSMGQLNEADIDHSLPEFKNEEPNILMCSGTKLLFEATQNSLMKSCDKDTRQTKDFDFDGESDEDSNEEDLDDNFGDDRTEVPNQKQKYFGEEGNGRTFSGDQNNLHKSQSYLFSKGDLAFPMIKTADDIDREEQIKQRELYKKRQDKLAETPVEFRAKTA